MEISNTQALAELCRVLRESGITHAKVGDIELTFGSVPPAPKAAATETESEPSPDSDTCPCGHAYYQHSEAGCFLGCPVSACVPSEPKGDE